MQPYLQFRSMIFLIFQKDQTLSSIPPSTTNTLLSLPMSGPPMPVTLHSPATSPSLTTLTFRFTIADLRCYLLRRHYLHLRHYLFRWLQLCHSPSPFLQIYNFTDLEIDFRRQWLRPICNTKQLSVEDRRMSDDE